MAGGHLVNVKRRSFPDPQSNKERKAPSLTTTTSLIGTFRLKEILRVKKRFCNKIYRMSGVYVASANLCLVNYGKKTTVDVG